MSVNQNQEFQYYQRSKLFNIETSYYQVILHKTRILSSLVINHIDEETLQKILKIKAYNNKSKGKNYITYSIQLWNLYQTIKNGYTFDEDTSYNNILTSIREKYTPKTDKQLRDKFCKIFDKGYGYKINLNINKYFDEFQHYYEANSLFTLLYCWFKINEENEKDWIGIPDYIKDIDDVEFKEIWRKKLLNPLVNLAY